MASATPVSGASAYGSKRSLDAELNLVPFIDLLSMCICFLLITAVWVEIGGVQVKQSHGTEGAAAVKDEIELRLSLAPAGGWQLEARRAGKVVKKAAAQGPEAFSGTVAQWVGEWGAARVGGAIITTRTEVSYGDLVSMMDVLRRHKISNLGVTPAGGGA